MSQMRFRFHSILVLSIDPETALHTLLLVTTGARNRSSLHYSGPTRRRIQCVLGPILVILTGE